MEVDDTEGGSTDDASMEGGDPSEEHSNDDELLEGSDAEEGSTDVPMPDATAVGGSDGEEQDYMILPELAAKYPSVVLKLDWTPAPHCISPATNMIAILLSSLDPLRVTDHRTLLRTCRLPQLGGQPPLES